MSAGIDDVALLNPDGSRVLIAYNTSASTIRFSVAWQGRSFTYSLPVERRPSRSAGIRSLGFGCAISDGTC